MLKGGGQKEGEEQLKKERKRRKGERNDRIISIDLRFSEGN